MADQTPIDALGGDKREQKNETEKSTNASWNNGGSQLGRSRNNNLATLANAARSFKGKIQELPIIGKQYENVGVAWDILQKDLAEYAVLNLDYGDDMVPLIESMTDKPEECHGEAPKWDNQNKDDYGEQQIYSKKLDIYLKRESAYKRNKKKVYTLLYGQCTPSLLSGIKSANNFTKKDKEKDPMWIMTMIQKLSVGIGETENELCTAFYTLKRFYSGDIRSQQSQMTIGWT